MGSSGYIAEASERRSRRQGRNWWKTALVVLLFVFLAGSVGVIGLFAWVAKDLPDPNNLASRTVAQTTKIYDRAGKTILYEVHGDVKRTVVPLAQISPNIQHAVIAIEDRYFYEHKGVRITSIIRAFIMNALKMKSAQGGSTITQQFIKNSVLTTEKKLVRKIKEAILAVEMEQHFSKDTILEMYLNDSPFGSYIYGVEAASETMFGKSAAEVTPSEAAILASILKAPTYYSPYGIHTDELVKRSHLIIDQMAAQGYLTADETKTAKDDDVLAHIKPKREAIIAPHFVLYVRDLMAQKFGDAEIEKGGYRIITTLDMDKQKLAEEAVSQNATLLKKWGANTAAMMAVNPKTGEILAMIGSADYWDEEINGHVNALLTRLQPGSSIKPVMYAAAFEKGYTPDTVLYDVETVFKNYPEDYIPHDYDGKERGPVTVRESLAGSLNVPAVAMLYLTGIDRFVDFAHRLGYTTYENKSAIGLSLVLGGADVRPIEHITAFSAFAQEGLLPASQAVLRVEDSQGNVLYDAANAPPPKKVLEPEIARQINSILSDNAARAPIFGEHNFLTLADRPVCAKTGTTNSYKDAWTIGYTPSLVTGIWVGIQQGGKMKQGADGSKVAAPIWNQFMQAALKGTPPEQFTAPQPVVTGKPVLDGDKTARTRVKIDRASGKLATDLTPPDYVEERAYGLPHSILSFVDKDDPRGPIPADPTKDPEFPMFEAAVAKWAQTQNISGSVPPTETDDVHVPENVPTISLTYPSDGAQIADRAFTPQYSASARRGVAKIDFLMDDEPIGSILPYAYGAQVTVPNRFTKGFHKLTVRALDDVGNRADMNLTVNLTAEAGPLGVAWTKPYAQQLLSGAGDFPFLIQYRLDDPHSIRVIKVKATRLSDQNVTEIGSTSSPSMNNMSMTWKAAVLGNYELSLEATLTSGDVRTERIQVMVVQ